jgi:hypothetical protein
MTDLPNRDDDGGASASYLIAPTGRRAGQRAEVAETTP